jgi:DNA-3-methyladenine glycosylase II
MATRATEIEGVLREAEPRLAVVFDAVGPPPVHRPDPVPERFARLATAILHQQLAGPAAGAITRRATEALGGRLDATALLMAPPAALRSAGVSQAKLDALLDLATRVDTGVLDLKSIGRKPDALVIEQLSAVRGIGTWTAEMFLMHALGRPDVWPTGDLGVRQGWALLAAEEVSTPAALKRAADHCAPWRSSVAWACWQAVGLERQGELRLR